jgi:putative hydrolase of the HAD superfamily
MSEQKHLFFDLDRTLWDFEKNSQQALRILYNNLDLDREIGNFYTFLHTYKRINSDLWVKYGKGKITKEELRNIRFEQCLAKFDINDSSLHQKLSDGYIQISPDQQHIFPFAHETLKDLKNEGFRLHIITNGFKEVQYRKLTNCNFLPYFDVIVCSEEVGKTKPAPEVFHHAMRLANASPSKSVMIGDDLQVDVIGASNAGMHAVFFDPEKKARKKKENHIHCLSELPELLPWIFRSHLN